MNLKYLLVTAAVYVSVSLCSCSDTDTVRDESPTAVFGETVFLPAEKGSEIKISMQMECGWQLTSDIDWAAIYPMSGEAGDVTLTFRTTDANTGVWERTAYFEIETDGNILNCLLVQEGRPGTSPVSAVGAFDGEDEGTLSVEVWTNTEFSASMDCQWAVVDGIRYGLDSVLLDDDRNYSAMRKAVVDIRMPAYSSDATVTADLLLECGEYVDTVRIYRSFVDKKRDFYRKSVLFNFTGQGCSWCPYMTDGIYKVLEQEPDRIEVIKLYGYGEREELYTGSAAVLDEFFAQEFNTGAPYSVFNFIAGVESHGERVDELAAKLQTLSEEAVEHFPAGTGIYAESEYENGKLTLSGFVVSEEDKECQLSAFVREDGLIASQAGRGNDYEHNFVLRAAVTEELGENLIFQGRTAAFHITYELPDGMLEDPDNASLLIYTSYPTDNNASGSVAGVKYVDLGMIVDNAVSLSLDGKVDIRYE